METGTKSEREINLEQALIKCRDIFERLANEGKYPDFMLQVNGGEGFQFITKALNHGRNDKVRS